MDILVEFTGEAGVTQRLQINNAPKGTELVVLEQFLAGPIHLARMISEASEGQPEPEIDLDILEGLRVEIDGPSKDSVFAVRQTIENAQQAARRSGRIENSPVNVGRRAQLKANQQAAAAAERIQKSKQVRVVNNLQAAASECLKVLEEAIKEKSNRSRIT